MDKNEHFPLSHIPMRSFSLRLARSTIKMQHEADWRVDKVNPVHDLIIPLTGAGRYVIYGEEIIISPGEAMLIPPYTRFKGQHGGGSEDYTGIAQHFTLELFGKGDVLPQMELKQKVRLSHWDSLEPLVRHYRDTGPKLATTLSQHHQFMVLLLAYLEDAFIGWKADDETQGLQDQLSLHIMFVASRLSADPLGRGVEEALESVPYNRDYFRRAFKDRIGMTPQKFRELKRMEFAIHRLDAGLSVKQVAVELGYSDPYFFSRMFKRFIGDSPSSYRDRSANSAAD